MSVLPCDVASKFIGVFMLAFQNLTFLDKVKNYHINTLWIHTIYLSRQIKQ